MVELVAIEVEAANQRADCTRMCVDRQQGCLHFWKLNEFPALFAIIANAHDGAAPDPSCLGRLVVQHRGGKLDAVAGQCQGFTSAEYLDFTRRCFEDDSGKQVVEIARFAQCFF
ncbi:hypothetical protein SDC9_210974 [bioreactor metagenome]|uniref:Uncharacterized protein n=1 Tax=bioreactor metagenome TaxID=1076179 RepID=A0A645JIP1_9ZZZZ